MKRRMKMITAITTITMITMITVTKESLAHMQRNSHALTNAFRHRAAANRAAFRGTISEPNGLRQVDGSNPFILMVFSKCVDRINRKSQVAMTLISTARNTAF